MIEDPPEFQKNACSYKFVSERAPSVGRNIFSDHLKNVEMVDSVRERLL